MEWEIGRNECRVDDFVVEPNQLPRERFCGQGVEEDILVGVHGRHGRCGWDITEMLVRDAVTWA